MSMDLFRLGNLYAGPPGLAGLVDPDVIVSLTRFVAPHREGVRVYRFPIRDFSIYPLENIAGALRAIHGELGAGRKVYVHCTAGCGRTGTVVIAYLILYRDMRLERAYALFTSMRGCGPESEEQYTLLSLLDYLHSSLGLAADGVVGLLELYENIEELMDYASHASSRILGRRSKP